MNPELSGFALGLLFGAAKIAAIGSVGFAIAWWRARLRVRQLETEQAELRSLPEERLARLEAATEAIAGQLERLLELQSGRTIPRIEPSEAPSTPRP